MRRLGVALRALGLLALGLLAPGPWAGPGLAQDTPARPAIHAPIVITSAGQGADATVLNALLRRAQVTAALDETITAEGLADVRTLLVVLGGSQKALGAAGISVEDELNRLDALLDAAEAGGLTVVALHIGGEARRGPLSQPFLDAVAGRAQGLIVTREGDKDGYFTTLATDRAIPLYLLERVNEVPATIVELVAD